MVAELLQALLYCPQTLWVQKSCHIRGALWVTWCMLLVATNIDTSRLRRACHSVHRNISVYVKSGHVLKIKEQLYS